MRLLLWLAIALSLISIKNSSRYDSECRCIERAPNDSRN